MKFGLTHGNIGDWSSPAAAAELAAAAESAGFDTLWTVEHVVRPLVYEPLYPETDDGLIPFPADEPIADPLIWMAFAAAHTTTLKLGTGVMVLPQRNALVTAKEVATLDRLSGGRTILGVGAGWLREEFTAVGCSFADRGSRLDDAIHAMRALWIGDPASYRSKYVTFNEVVSSPRPYRTTVPIHIGGFTVPAAIRAGRIGDGFFPGGYGDRDRLAMLIARCRSEASAAGRKPQDIEITARWTKNRVEITNLDTILRLANIGVDRVTVPTFIFDADRIVEDLADFGKNVIEKFAGM